MGSDSYLVDQQRIPGPMALGLQGGESILGQHHPGLFPGTRKLGLTRRREPGAATSGSPDLTLKVPPSFLPSFLGSFSLLGVFALLSLTTKGLRASELLQPCLFTAKIELMVTGLYVCKYVYLVLFLANKCSMKGSHYYRH